MSMISKKKKKNFLNIFKNILKPFKDIKEAPCMLYLHKEELMISKIRKENTGILPGPAINLGKIF